MCLLIRQFKDTNFTDEHIRDFYSRNRDGVGVMWAENGELHYNKLLPRNAEECLEFYNRVARGKDCCVHFRMRTHGKIDNENCHPYEVFGFTTPSEMPMLLMHNGILHTGNTADTTKSDTWHYIANYLRPLIEKDPDQAFQPHFADVIGKHIGQNRFVLMDQLGRVAVINKQQGLMFMGAWLSNTYAWSSARYIPALAAAETKYHNSGYTGSWDTLPKKKAKTVAKTTKTGGKKSLFRPATEDTTLGQLALAWDKKTRGPVSEPEWDAVLNADVADIRIRLDSVYTTNSTLVKQLRSMVTEMGVVAVYEAVEMLAEGEITELQWDRLSTNRTEMRSWLAPHTAWRRPFGPSQLKAENAQLN